MEVIETVKCNVDLGKIIDIKGFQLEKVLEMDPNFLDVRPVPAFSVDYSDCSCALSIFEGATLSQVLQNIC